MPVLGSWERNIVNFGLIVLIHIHINQNIYEKKYAVFIRN